MDKTTEIVVMGFLDLVAERKIAGRAELAATQDTIAQWMGQRTDLPLKSRHIQILVATLAEAGIISIGGQGIGKPNLYTTREQEMGSEQFWNQVDALLTVWKHPARKEIAGG